MREQRRQQENGCNSPEFDTKRDKLLIYIGRA